MRSGRRAPDPLDHCFLSFSLAGFLFSPDVFFSLSFISRYLFFFFSEATPKTTSRVILDVYQACHAIKNLNNENMILSMNLLWPYI
ncbi:hypothetical protein BO82DRAFT_50942 [Aspergillus uvarum CBS 121591]|uniref:Uncharacterized protein n=1 Tax=Aspergillus uvarum CBS 121591 TaxID=1448315 RepID=A0A319CQL5_9EURO|nr:hypothetical protein BO82DRAFT_50942 [Aspergillus uvarum CBS 121591]PYH86699.1 hypothetical protein BO82DRAFT_50942 [Aspergillus uvarum CBS 121591]